ncbi:MAG: efflux RND transporter periplasmic adaptor subunit, partial [Magnetococcales bacterium]|nr:efflux RND transporter periplasmic adaptor subunit [Magnetococcales bacterium]
LGARIDPVSQSIKITGRFIKHPDDILAGMSGTALFYPASVVSAAP